MRLVLLLLCGVACGRGERGEQAAKADRVFYCDSDRACSLLCAKEPCTTQATATCGWLAGDSTFLCYADPADCTEARKLIRLSKCELKTPDELLPR